MDLKFIINLFLIIILLHLILKTIKFNKVINIIPNNIKESFSKKIDEFSKEHKKTMDFLLDINDDKKFDEKFTQYKENTCYYQLNDDINKCQNENIKAGNYYVDNENNSNFMSNVLNLNKFYNKNDSDDSDNSDDLENYNNLTETQLLSIKNVENKDCYKSRNTMRNNTENTELFRPDNWNYKNELPMNGGNIVGNVVGYDTLNDGYAMFYEKGKLLDGKCNDIMDCNVRPDDIRFGLGNPNRENRDTE